MGARETPADMFALCPRKHGLLREHAYRLTEGRFFNAFLPQDLIRRLRGQLIRQILRRQAELRFASHVTFKSIGRGLRQPVVGDILCAFFNESSASRSRRCSLCSICSKFSSALSGPGHM